MTELNQNPMNTNQRSKAPLVLFIVCILVLIIVGGYFAYAKSLSRDTAINNITKTDNVNNTIANNSTDTDTNTDTSINTQIPSDWTEHELTSCGAKIQTPNNWQLGEESIVSDNDTANNIYTLTSAELTSSIEKSRQESSAVYEGMTNDFIIKCYDSLDQLTRKWWDLNRVDNTDVQYPSNLQEALLAKGLIGIYHQASEPLPIMGVDGLEKAVGGEKNAFVGYEIGTPGTVLIYYFGNPQNSKIISFESEMTEYQEKKLKQPHSQIVENLHWLK